jgi:hypothetical protein
MHADGRRYEVSWPGLSAAISTARLLAPSLGGSERSGINDLFRRFRPPSSSDDFHRIAGLRQEGRCRQAQAFTAEKETPMKADTKFPGRDYRRASAFIGGSERL